MMEIAPTALLNNFFNISRLLAGQLDFLSAIRSVADEIANILPHDHLDVCIVRLDGKFHTAYETGIETDWGTRPHAPIASSPIRSVLLGVLITSSPTTPAAMPGSCSTARFTARSSHMGCAAHV